MAHTAPFLSTHKGMEYLAVTRSMYTKYLDDYQKQFTDWQDQFSEWQKKYFDSWLESFPNGKTEVNFSETFDKALTLQEELVKTYLESQEKASQMMIESQKKFWHDYFEMMRKQTNVTAA